MYSLVPRNREPVDPFMPTQQFIEFATRHWILSLAFVVIVVALIVNEIINLFGARGSVSTTEAIRMINREDAQVFDVRSQGDYRQSHIINAKNVPSPQLDERMKDLSKYKSQPVIVYCTSGDQAPRVRERLVERGFEKVYYLKGGLGAWQTAGLPVARK